MNERAISAVSLCQRYIQVEPVPKGYWRAWLVCRIRRRVFTSTPQRSMREAVRDAYRAAGDPQGMGLPVFDTQGQPIRGGFSPSGPDRCWHP